MAISNSLAGYISGLGATIAIVVGGDSSKSKLTYERKKYNIDAHHYNKAYTPKQIKKMVYLYKSGATKTEIAKQHGITVSTVSNYLNYYKLNLHLFY
jgi:DNA invertase Pin-like site-specific DNA recombinase